MLRTRCRRRGRPTTTVGCGPNRMTTPNRRSVAMRSGCSSTVRFPSIPAVRSPISRSPPRPPGRSSAGSGSPRRRWGSGPSGPTAIPSARRTSASRAGWSTSRHDCRCWWPVWPASTTWPRSRTVSSSIPFGFTSSDSDQVELSERNWEAGLRAVLESGEAPRTLVMITTGCAHHPRRGRARQGGRPPRSRRRHRGSQRAQGERGRGSWRRCGGRRSGRAGDDQRVGRRRSRVAGAG